MTFRVSSLLCASSCLGLLAGVFVSPNALAASTPATSVKLPAVTVQADHISPSSLPRLGGYGRADIQNTPASIRVMPSHALENRQVRTLSEVIQADASLGNSYAPIGYYQNINIRGYALDLATGYRLNGMSVVGQQLAPLEGVQQIAVLKGLAGISAGMMAPGGLINYVAKRPKLVRQFTLATDEQGSRYGALDVGSWLTPTFGLRFNAAWGYRNSYVEDTDGRRQFYSLSGEWKITPDLTLQFYSDYRRSRQYSVSGYQLLGGTTVPTNIDRSKLLANEPWRLPVKIRSYNNTANLTYRINPDWTGSLSLSHSDSVIQDNSAFAYGGCLSCTHVGAFFAPNGDYGVYDYRSPDDQHRNDEIRLAFNGLVTTGQITHELTIGADVLHIRYAHSRNEVFDWVGRANIHQENTPYFAPSPRQPASANKRLDSWQRSVFLLDRLHLTPHWQLVAGGHWVRLSEHAWDAAGNRIRETDKTTFLPQAAVLWKPSPILTNYLSYSEGLSEGLVAPWWTSNAGNSLAPRRSHQIEVGSKYRLSQPLLFTAALFRINQPYQYGKPVTSASGFTFVEQGKAIHTGLELALDGHWTPRLATHLSMAYIRARVKNTGTPAYEGHQLPNVPKFRASLNASWRVPRLNSLTLLGSLRYASDKVAHINGQAKVSDYDVVDMGLKFVPPWQAGHVTWRLMVKNVFNQFYWKDTGSMLGDSYLFPGAPRQARLSFTVDW